MAPHRKRQRVSEDGTAVATFVNKDLESGKQTSTASEQIQKEKPTRSLFVRSLAAITTNEDLTDHFSQSYPIKHAIAVIDSGTKQCKGYGFVTFADVEDAQRAKDEFDGSTLQGRKIKVEFAEPRQRNDEDGTKLAESIPKTKSIRDRSFQPPPKLIVRNLPWSIKEPHQLEALFRSYGKIKHAVVPKMRDGTMSGFGIVLIRGQKNAEKAIEGVNGKEIDGRTLAVDWAVDKETWEQVKAREEKDSDATAEILHSEEQPAGAAETQAQSALEEDTLLSRQHVPEDDVESDGTEVLDASLESDMEDEEDDRMKADDEHLKRDAAEDMSPTLFIRNLPFTCSDEDLFEHFEQFGRLRYARVVLDRETERPRGTGFVCFVRTVDADACVKEAPKHQQPASSAGGKVNKTSNITHSVLQDVDADPTGKYTLEGRVLQISRAVQKDDAVRLTEEGSARRFARDKDKRRLYLLSEGTIPSNSPLYKLLKTSEIAMRESSFKQRKSLIETNPSLHFSLTRLSVRNIPRSMTSKDLKALAREAVVGFAKDVKEGKRQALSKEEKSRAENEMREAERSRKLHSKGVVRQAKIVFEGQEGGKVTEASGAGRSRGYGFIEYYTHRSALMSLRWLNGHAVDYTAKDSRGKPLSREELQDRKKRLIVEFAIENAQVVARRKDNEKKAQTRSKTGAVQHENGDEVNRSTKSESGRYRAQAKNEQGSRKRKRDEDNGTKQRGAKEKSNDTSQSEPAKDEKSAKREKIIQRKRMMRRARKKSRTT